MPISDYIFRKTTCFQDFEQLCVPGSPAVPTIMADNKWDYPTWRLTESADRELKKLLLAIACDQLAGQKPDQLKFIKITQIIHDDWVIQGKPWNFREEEWEEA